MSAKQFNQLIHSLLIITCLSTAIGAQETDVYRVKLSGYSTPVDGNTAVIEGELIFPDENYRLQSLEPIRTEAGDVILKAVVGITEKYILNPVPVVEPFSFQIESINKDRLRVMVEINGEMVHRDEFILNGEIRPTPTPRQPSLLKEAIITIKPENPKDGDEIHAAVSGHFTNSRHRISDSSIQYQEDAIILDLRVISEEIGNTVITPVSHDFNLGNLKAGGYAVILIVNGVETAYDKFFIQGDTDPDPNQDQTPFHSRIWIEYEEPWAGHPFTIYLVGEFPSSGYSFKEKELTVNGSSIEASVIIEEPTDEVLTVIDPFREPIGTIALEEGRYQLNSMVNGQKLPTFVFTVGKSRPTEKPKNSMLTFTRDGGFAGMHNVLNVDVLGNYTIEGLPIDSKIHFGMVPSDRWSQFLSLLRSVDFQSLDPVYDTDLTIADGFVYTVEYAGNTVRVYQEARMPESLESLISLLEQMLSLPFKEPTEDMINFTREGGFAGEESRMDLDLAGNFKRYIQRSGNGDLGFGDVPPHMWERFQNTFSTLDFDSLSSSYEAEIPISDGFVYSINYAGKSVTVQQGADIPPALDESISLLEEFMALPERDDENVTAVQNWQFY